MSIILMIVAIVLFFICAVIPFTKFHGILAIVFLIIAILNGVAIVANDTYNFGMKVTTTTKTTKLVSTSDKLNLLLYKPLGNGSEKVYIYKTDAKQKAKTMHTQNSSAKYLITTDTPELQIIEQRYTYQNELSRVFFGILNNNNKLKHRHYIFKINNDWNVLSINQAKQLTKIVEKNKDSVKMQVKSIVSEKISVAMQSNPQMTTEQQKKLAIHVQEQATQEVMQKLVESVKNK